MADLKVFVSSTCYDLAIVREQLKKFIGQMGYQSVLSDYTDIVYDPREHTHSSCIQEVNNIDILVLIIGSRYGGEVIPEALAKIDIDRLKNISKNKNIFEDGNSISITQAEVLKAIELEIPIYIFVNEKVYHEYFMYTKNRDLIDKINFPSIDTQGTAKYIFNFIDFLSHRLNNNNIMTYSKLEDIELQLKKQWAGYFQRLLKEQATFVFEAKNFDSLFEKINDLKVAMISTITNEEAKNIAKYAIEYRKLIELFAILKIERNLIIQSKQTFVELLKSVKIKSVLILDEEKRPNSFIFIKEDNKIIESRMSLHFMSGAKEDWDIFKALKEEHKKIVFETLFDDFNNRGFRTFYLRLTTETLEEYLESKDIQNIDIKNKIKDVEFYFE
ncbi:MAG: DUF4062 domain-containing protein [Arcobacteraceae bacterium]|nr:DUF4062 domain-containing protein [Arcobacteraceae bacterium]